MSGSENDCEVICYCSGTKRQEIKKLIEQGTNDLERISRITGAMSGCGGCEFEMRAMLESYCSTAESCRRLL